MNKKIIFGLIGLAGIAYGIGYFKRQTDLLRDTCINFLGGAIESFNISSTTLRIDLLIVNKSSMTFELSKQVHQILINEKHITDIQMEEPLVVQGGERKPVSVSVTFNPIDLLVSSVLDIKNLRLGIKSSLNFKSGLIFFNNITFENESTIKDLLSGNNEVC